MYDVNLRYRPCKTLQNAGALSQFPLPEVTEETFPQGDIPVFDGPSLATSTIAEMTSKDLVLSRLYSALQAGTVESLHNDDDFST